MSNTSELNWLPQGGSLVRYRNACDAGAKCFRVTSPVLKPDHRSRTAKSQRLICFSLAPTYQVSFYYPCCRRFPAYCNCCVFYGFPLWVTPLPRFDTMNVIKLRGPDSNRRNECLWDTGGRPLLHLAILKRYWSTTRYPSRPLSSECEIAWPKPCPLCILL